MNKPIPTLVVVLALTLNAQAAPAKDDSEESHGCKEVHKIFKGKYKCKEVGDFHGASERKTKLREINIDPSMAPIAGGGRSERKVEKQESQKNSSQNTDSVKKTLESKEKNEEKK